jgi:hypothetical protein
MKELRSLLFVVCREHERHAGRYVGVARIFGGIRARLVVAVYGPHEVLPGELESLRSLSCVTVNGCTATMAAARTCTGRAFRVPGQRGVMHLREPVN